MTDKIVVFSTCASQEEAEKLARLVVEQGHAACASIVPNVRSYYRWRGAVETAGEYLLIIKSARRRFAALCAALERAHAYEVPEVLAMPVVAGAAPYLAWLESSLGGEKEDASR
ncbi:MAG: divalent-cation tolerance protein CutA [Bryobacteraceae bacterium]|jgi:periplasmic divalent cation tolerance protein